MFNTLDYPTSDQDLIEDLILTDQFKIFHCNNRLFQVIISNNKSLMDGKYIEVLKI